MSGARALGILFAVIGGLTLLGAGILVNAEYGGPLAAYPTLHAGFALVWMFGLWATLAIGMIFFAAWVMQDLQEPSSVHAGAGGAAAGRVGTVPEGDGRVGRSGSARSARAG